MNTYQLAAEANKLLRHSGGKSKDEFNISIIKSAIEKAYERGKDDMRWVNQQLDESRAAHASEARQTDPASFVPVEDQIELGASGTKK